MPSAIFLDRDGVINRLIFDPGTGRYGAPYFPCDWEILPEAIASLKQLQAAGYWLFLVSNQAGCAEGKTSLENLKAIHEQLETELTQAGVTLKASYYCYHLPEGIVSEHAGPCACRKPSPYFIHKAVEAYGVDLKTSWMVGDEDADVHCGINAGVRTILIKNPESFADRGKCRAEFEVEDLADAVETILKSGPAPGS